MKGIEIQSGPQSKSLRSKSRKHDAPKEYMICLNANLLGENSKLGKRDPHAKRQLEFGVLQGLNGPIIALEIQDMSSVKFWEKAILQAQTMRTEGKLYSYQLK